MHFGTGCLGQALVWIPKPVVTFELYNASEGLHFHQQESNFILMEDKGLAFEKEGGPGRVGPVLGRSLLVGVERVIILSLSLSICAVCKGVQFDDAPAT